MNSLEDLLAAYPEQFRRLRVSDESLTEAKKRVLDSLGCFSAGYFQPAVQRIRESSLDSISGPCTIWGTDKKAPADVAALVNGSSVRALDYNDTYLSKEPCHPSDLLSSFWAACELSQASKQGDLLTHALVLGYEVLCRLCDAASLRKRGWDHVTYLPIASVVGCSLILGLTEKQTRHAIALAITGHVALRQTRVGEISDWKAACAARAASAGLLATLWARRGLTGPSDIFSGKHGFENQLSGRLSFSRKPLGRSWKIMETHTKFYPAEHHAQSAIEAALQIRKKMREQKLGFKKIKKILIDCFDVAVDIIGSEPEKWTPTTRETADHSMPYLVVAALLDGKIDLQQFQQKRYLDADVKILLSKVDVRRRKEYSALYPERMPSKVFVQLEGGKIIDHEILQPLGYANRPMSFVDVQEKFERLSNNRYIFSQQQKISSMVVGLNRIKEMTDLSRRLRFPK